MDNKYSIDISIIKSLLGGYSECFAGMSNQQLENAFLSDHLGSVAFVKKNYTAGDCFYKVRADSKIGVDIPVKISKGEEANGKIIMFVGESVLRNPDDDFDEDCLLVGTPFAIVGVNKQPESCDVYKMIFKYWLNKDYQIYVTDYIKKWKQGDNYLEGKKNKSFRERSQDLLEKEIEKLAPDYIVSFGNEAENVIKRIVNARKKRKDSPIRAKMINLTHPSNNAKIHWKIQMYEELIDYLLQRNSDKEKIKQMEGMKVYKNKVCDDNVARFANKIIERKIKEYSGYGH